MAPPRFTHSAFYVVMYREGDSWAPLYSPCRRCTHISLHTTHLSAEFEMEQARDRGLEMEIVELIPVVQIGSAEAQI